MFFSLILTHAIQENVELVLFELKKESGEKANFIFAVTFKTGCNIYEFKPPPTHLFDSVKRIILNAGGISGEFETEKPPSKWKIESQNLTDSLQLKWVFAR